MTAPDIVLRAVTATDLEFTRAVRNDPQVHTLTLGRRFPITEIGEQRWFEGLGQGAFPTEATFIVAEASGEPLGMVSIHGIDWINRTAWFGIWIAPDQQGRGIGARATTLAVAIAKDRLELRRLKLQVLAEHTPALRIYSRVGFREEGRLVGEILLAGAEQDVLLLACKLRDVDQ